jgi:hypothetical protein
MFIALWDIAMALRGEKKNKQYSASEAWQIPEGCLKQIMTFLGEADNWRAVHRAPEI